MCIVNSVAMFEAQLTSVTFKPSSFLLVSVANVLPNQNGEIFHPRAEFQIAWIHIKMDFSQKNWTKNCKCDHTFRIEYIVFATVPLRL